MIQTGFQYFTEEYAEKRDHTAIILLNKLIETLPGYCKDIVKEKVKKYEQCRLVFRISEDEWERKRNRKNYEVMKEALDSVGVSLEISAGTLDLQIRDWEFVSKNDRYAGRNRRCIMKEVGDFKYEPYRYSDIILLMQEMPSRQVMKQIGVPRSTYYRRVSEMKESEYYRSLDPDIPWTKEYLEGKPFNLAF